MLRCVNTVFSNVIQMKGYERINLQTGKVSKIESQFWVLFLYSMNLAKGGVCHTYLNSEATRPIIN